MEGWNKLQASINSINFTQAGNKITKGFNSSVQATRERLGQVAPDEITELPQGLSSFTNFGLVLKTRIEYKDLEARVDALRTAHLSLLK
jgi:hypothetical protein